MQLKEAVKAEMHQSVVEVGTGICNNIQEAREEVRQLRGAIITLARENGLRLARFRHASFCRLEKTGDLSRRALLHHRGGYENRRAW